MFIPRFPFFLPHSRWLGKQKRVCRTITKRSVSTSLTERTISHRNYDYYTTTTTTTARRPPLSLPSFLFFLCYRTAELKAMRLYARLNYSRVSPFTARSVYFSHFATKKKRKQVMQCAYTFFLEFLFRETNRRGMVSIFTSRR